MRIERIFDVKEIKITKYGLVVTLDGDSALVEKSTLTFGQGLEHLGIVWSLDLLETKLHCVLESKELPLDQGSVDIRDIARDDLVISNFEKIQRIVPPSFLFDSPVREESFRRLGIETFGADPFNGSIPCPLYRVNLHLTEEEEKGYRELPLNTVFAMTITRI